MEKAWCLASGSLKLACLDEKLLTQIINDKKIGGNHWFNFFISKWTHLLNIVYINQFLGFGDHEGTCEDKPQPFNRSPIAYSFIYNYSRLSWEIGIFYVRAGDISWGENVSAVFSTLNSPSSELHTLEVCIHQIFVLKNRYNHLNGGSSLLILEWNGHLSPLKSTFKVHLIFFFALK